MAYDVFHLPAGLEHDEAVQWALSLRLEGTLGAERLPVRINRLDDDLPPILRGWRQDKRGELDTQAIEAAIAADGAWIAPGGRVAVRVAQC